MLLAPEKNEFNARSPFWCSIVLTLSSSDHAAAVDENHELVDVFQFRFRSEDEGSHVRGLILRHLDPLHAMLVQKLVNVVINDSAQLFVMLLVSWVISGLVEIEFPLAEFAGG